MQRKWQTLFTRYGFEVTGDEEEMDLQRMTERNRSFLKKILTDFKAEFFKNDSMLVINSPVVTEDQWITLKEKHVDGRTGSSFFPTDIPVEKLDIYISGIVMQLNRLGYVMTFSCDGHVNRKANIYFENVEFACSAQSVLSFVETPTRREGVRLIFTNERTTLPTTAEKLSLISSEHAVDIILQSDELFTKDNFEKQLEVLLNIPGASSKEGKVRAHVMREIKPFIDHVTIDHAGNILAIKRFGPGPTVLLNAHLDTVVDIVPNREIMKDESIWSSSEGILGADDRAGVNVVLAAAKTVDKSTFNGTVKYIFTVEEEIGLCGAREVTKSFLWDIDMAFVIDRRGTSDIVTSRGGYEPFCRAEFGAALEHLAGRSGYKEWHQVAGGSSDTFIWAQSGIESVNLSAGYQFEHTDAEQLDVDACYGTYEFLMEILNNARQLQNRMRRLTDVRS